MSNKFVVQRIKGKKEKDTNRQEISIKALTKGFLITKGGDRFAYTSIEEPIREIISFTGRNLKEGSVVKIIIEVQPKNGGKE